MSQSITLRIFLGILGLVVVFHGPWLLSCVIIVIGAMWFRLYLEAMLFGVALDIVVGYDNHYFLIFATVLIVLASFAQNKMSLYGDSNM